MRQGYRYLVERTKNAYLIDADDDVDAIRSRVIELLKEHNITDLCPLLKS